MKFCLLLAVSLISVVAHAAEWQSELTPAKPGAFPPLRPLHARYKFGWSAFTAANADFDLSRAKGGLLRLNLKTKTTGFVRTLWRMDAEHTSLLRTSTFQPVQLEQKEIYKDETRTTRVAFDGESATRTRESVPPAPGKKKAKRFEAADIFDLHGALHFIRSQPLKAGDVYKLIVYPASSPYLAQVNVLGRDRVDAAGRKWDAVKMDLKLWRIDDDDLELKPYIKFKRATAWVSDDNDRLLLKVQAEISVGSVWTELEQVEFR
ncbi:DUF3108 domain-containing protein [Verrucomicrobiota bacterium sgz303538]